MRGFFLATLAMLASIPALTTSSYAADLSGRWGSKYGEIELSQKGDSVTGTLARTSGFCPFADGEKLLEGSVSGDTLTASFRMCQVDDDCGPPATVSALLVLGKNGSVLSGAAVAPKTACPLVGFSTTEHGQRGLYFKRAKTGEAGAPPIASAASAAPAASDKSAPTETSSSSAALGPAAASPPSPTPVLPGPAATPGTYDPRATVKVSAGATEKLLAGKHALEAGQFEAARRAFEEALVQDPTNPTALVGIGASYYGRQDRAKAMEYYKRALAEDPNFGMAYYNIACLYALDGDAKMALDYLKIAFLNGFVPLAEMEADPDLASLRGLPEYKALVEGEF
ncbi:MAG: tetratricopeptide repeat protein [Myxococcales bacterium]|nr:MAG: tetratricopeptide repeat protein [Myxococcales bacterium]